MYQIQGLETESTNTPSVLAPLLLKARLLAESEMSISVSLGDRGTIEVPKSSILSCNLDNQASNLVIEIMPDSKLQIKTTRNSAGIVDSNVFALGNQGYSDSGGDCQCDCSGGEACECCNECDCDCTAENYSASLLPHIGEGRFRVTTPYSEM